MRARLFRWGLAALLLLPLIARATTTTSSTSSTSTTSTSSTTTSTIDWSFATGFTVNVGSVSDGQLTDTYATDNAVLVLREVTGVPGFDYVFTFGTQEVVPTSLSLTLTVVGWYRGAITDVVKWRIWNPTTAAWEVVTGATLGPSVNDQSYTWTLPTPTTTYVDGGGLLKLQLLDATPGSPTNLVYLNLVQLAQYTTTSTSTTSTSSSSSSSTSSSSTTTVATTSTTSTTLSAAHDTRAFQTACDTFSMPVLAARGSRIRALIKNLSAVVAYVCLAPTCATTTGYKLSQNETYEIRAYTGPVTCVAASTSATLSVSNEF